MGSDAPFVPVKSAPAVNPAPEAVPSTNSRLGTEPLQVFQKSLAVTPVAANPFFSVAEALVKATSMRVPAFDLTTPTVKHAAKSTWRNLKARIIRPAG